MLTARFLKRYTQFLHDSIVVMSLKLNRKTVLSHALCLQAAKISCRRINTNPSYLTTTRLTGWIKLEEFLASGYRIICSVIMRQ